jgi:hypothetical protein
MVRDQGRVADGTWVGFFPWRGDPVLSTSATSSANVPTGPLDTYGALLAFGAIGFCVFGIKAAPAVPRVLTGEPPPLRQFWPKRHRMIEWPLGRRQTTRSYRGYASSCDQADARSEPELIADRCASELVIR